MQQTSLLLRIGAGLLVLWGLLNAVGGALGARAHPVPWIGAFFAVVGLVIAAGGVGFWREKSWAIPVSLAGLLGLSLAALASGLVLRGAGGMRISHHAVRLVISAALFLIALRGARGHDRLP